MESNSNERFHERHRYPAAATVARLAPAAGVFVGILVPALVEMCGHAGFDFVIVDNEHGPAGIESTEHMVRAARGAGIIPVVRTVEADILRILDIGASAIQVPQVNTAEQARRIVAAAKYPPVDKRGAALSTRAAGYGFFAGEAHITALNEGTSVIVMAETGAAIENIDEIVAVRASMRCSSEPTICRSRWVIRGRCNIPKSSALSSMAWRRRSLPAWHRGCWRRASRISIDCAKWACATCRW